MRALELTETARQLGLLDFSNGKTPSQTMKARICTDIRVKGLWSRFKRTERGLFALRSLVSAEYPATPFEKRIRATEQVLVFPSILLNDVGSFHGITTDHTPYKRALLSTQNARFLRRVDMESSLAFKQVLGYVMIRHGDSVLRYVRGTYNSAVDWLKGRYCIGFGGHIESRDFNLLSLDDGGLRNGVWRELTEELHVPAEAINDGNLRDVGVLNDDSSDVGKSHFAFVMVLDIDPGLDIPDARKLRRERAINQLRFVPITKLGDEFERYEYWSKLCIQKFFGRDVTIRPKIHVRRQSGLQGRHRNIVIVGKMGSGKTEACKLLETKFGYRLVSSGQVLQRILHCPPPASLGRRTFQDVALAFIRRDDGPRKLADALCKQMSEDEPNPHVIDGIRNPRTLELLRDRLKGNVAVIYVDSAVDNLYRFFKLREDPKITFAQFLELLSHPVEQEVDQFFPLANVVFYNYGRKEAYIAAIERYFREQLA